MPVPLHVAEIDSGVVGAGVADAPAASTCAMPRAKVLPRMSPARAEAAVIAARIVAGAAHATTSLRNIGAALDVRHSAVERWANGDEPAAFTIRDLIAAHRCGEEDFAEHVWSQVQALFSAGRVGRSAASRVACDLMVSIGRVSETAVEIDADGHEAPTETARFVEALREIEQVAHAHRVERERGK